MAEGRTEQEETKQTKKWFLPGHGWVGLPGDWEFRQLLVFRPAREADEETTRRLRERALGPARKKALVVMAGTP